MKRYRSFEFLLLALAVAPLAILTFYAIRILINGETPELNWQTSTWGLVFLQVCALIGYAVHLSSNPRLTENQLSNWAWELLLYQNISMIIYWFKEVWGQPFRLRT